MSLSDGRIRILLPAAGGSTRMGPVDKRLLPHRGASLLADGVRRASILDPVPIVVLRPGDREVRETLEEWACVTVVNPDPERGPVSSVAVGGAAALERGASAVIVLLPDMPCVSAATLERVAKEFESRWEDVVVTCDYGGIAAPPVALPVRVLRTLAGFRGTVRKALNAMDETRVSVPAPAAELLDIDTPSDWRELRTRAHPASCAVWAQGVPRPRGDRPVLRRGRRR